MNRFPAPVWALSGLYVINAAMTAGLTLRYAEIVIRLDVSPGVFGVILLGEVVSLIGGMLTIAPFLINRYGAKMTARWSAIGYCSATALAGLAESWVWFSVALIVRGAVNAVLDIAVIRAASTAEQKYRRTLFTYLDIPAALSLLVTGGAGALAVGRLSVPAHSITLGGAGLILLLLVWRHIPADTREAVQQSSAPSGLAQSIKLSLLSATGLWLLLAGQDWTTLVYMELGVAPTEYGIGSMAFMLGVAIGLVVSGPLSDSNGRPFVLRVAASLVVVGMAAVLLLDSPTAVTVALAVAGFGAGPVHALALSAAGTGNRRTLTSVATFGHVGAAISKPTIGGLSAITGIQAALGITGVIFGLLVFVIAHSARTVSVTGRLTPPSHPPPNRRP